MVSQGALQVLAVKYIHTNLRYFGTVSAVGYKKAKRSDIKDYSFFFVHPFNVQI